MALPSLALPSPAHGAGPPVQDGETGPARVGRRVGNPSARGRPSPPRGSAPRKPSCWAYKQAAYPRALGPRSRRGDCSYSARRPNGMGRCAERVILVRQSRARSGRRRIQSRAREGSVRGIQVRVLWPRPESEQEETLYGVTGTVSAARSSAMPARAVAATAPAATPGSPTVHRAPRLRLPTPDPRHRGHAGAGRRQEATRR